MLLTENRLNAASFQIFPNYLIVAIACDWQQVQERYREAYERAQAVLRPAITDRLRPYWN